MSKETLQPLIEEIKKKKAMLLTWTAVGEYYGVHRAVVWRIVNDGYEPKNNDVRRNLGLPQIIEKELPRDAKGRFTKQ